MLVLAHTATRPPSNCMRWGADRAVGFPVQGCHCDHRSSPRSFLPCASSAGEMADPLQGATADVVLSGSAVRLSSGTQLIWEQS